MPFRSITEQRLEILKVIGASKVPLSAREVEELLPKHLLAGHTVSKQINNMKTPGYLDSIKKPGEPIRVKITKEGRARLKLWLTLEVIPFDPTAKRKYSKKVVPIRSAEETPEPINISAEADSVVEGISLVVNQNAEYRKLLMKIYKTIGAALDIREDQSNGSTSKDSDKEPDS